jgi:hypothetical protein
VSESTVALLCPQCALCCNGVLFADVRLQSADDPERLVALGVPLKRSARGARFPQPCSCLAGNLCRIYADRPARCRSFKCRLLQRTAAGETTPRAALNAIKNARARAEKVRRLLRELGDEDESLPLARRYQRMMRRPIDLAGEQRLVDLRGELMLAVAELTDLLRREFLT